MLHGGSAPQHGDPAGRLSIRGHRRGRARNGAGVHSSRVLCARQGREAGPLRRPPPAGSPRPQQGLLSILFTGTSSACILSFRRLVVSAQFAGLREEDLVFGLEGSSYQNASL